MTLQFAKYTRTWGLAPLLTAALLLSLACPVFAQAPATQPTAISPASQPREGLFTQALRLSESDRIALEAVRDDSQLDETAFKKLLARCLLLAALDEQRRPLDRPVTANMLEEPEHYRGRPIEMRIRVQRVERLMTSEDLTASLSWPAGRPFWKISGIDPNLPHAGEHPIVVFTPVEPELGTPDRVVDESEARYRLDTEAVVRGYFYKVWRQQDLEGNLRRYPVVMAWSVAQPAQTRRPGGGGPIWPGLVVVALLLLLLVFMWVKRRAAEARASGRPEYRPMRSGEQEPAAPDEPEGTDEQIDPAMRDAAEQYERERQNRDGADREG